MRDPPVVAGSNADIGDEKAGKAGLGGKAEVEDDVGHRVRAGRESLDGGFHAQGVEVHVGGNADLLTEELVEVRPRETGAARDLVQYDPLVDPLTHQLDGVADAKVPYRRRTAREGSPGRHPLPRLVEALLGQAVE